jgi:DNA-directed RNA polymerase subunit RPC12/RpoP
MIATQYACAVCTTDFERSTSLHCAGCGKHLYVGLTIESTVTFAHLNVKTNVVVCGEICAQKLRAAT